MEKFRVISDLHLDVNKKYPFNVKKDDIFTVVAGDTSGEWTIIDSECSDRFLNVKLGKHSRIAEYFKKTGKNGTVKLIFDAYNNKWKNAKDDSFISLADACIGFRPSYSTKEIKNGTVVKLKFTDVERWIRKNISGGIIIAGNHIVYNRDGKTIEELKLDLHEKFGNDDDITFLDESVGIMHKEVDGIVFIGSTLYTDYEYVSNIPSIKGIPMTKEEIVEMNLRRPMPKMDGTYLNDFEFGTTFEGTYVKNPYYGDEKDEIYHLTSKNYLNYFNKTFKAIEDIVKKNRNKDVVIVSHHCPSPKSISNEYVDSDLNASYVSNLEEFIKEHKNIKCWCCGHVHHKDSYKIGDCLVVMNPLGYCSSGQFLKNYDWSFNTFVNTKTWKLEKEEFDITKWKKKYENDRRKRDEFLLAFGSCFI